MSLEQCEICGTYTTKTYVADKLAKLFDEYLAFDKDHYLVCEYCLDNIKDAVRDALDNKYEDGGAM